MLAEVSVPSLARLFAHTYSTPANTTVIATIRMVAITGLTACSFLSLLFFIFSPHSPAGVLPLMMPIDIKVTAVLNQEVAIPKRNTGLISLVLLEYPVRKYNIIGLVQLFCRATPNCSLNNSNN